MMNGVRMESARWHVGACLPNFNTSTGTPRASGSGKSGSAHESIRPRRYSGKKPSGWVVNGLDVESANVAGQFNEPLSLANARIDSDYFEG